MLGEEIVPEEEEEEADEGLEVGELEEELADVEVED